MYFDAIMKVTQNNTGMYTKESSQQTFRIPNNNLDARFEQHHNIEIVQTRKENKDKPQYMMVKFQNVIILMHRTCFNQYQVSSAVLK